MGFRVTIVLPQGMSDERKKLIKAFGGEVLLTPGGESDVDLCIQKINEIVNENPKTYWFPNQFDNPNNPAAHFKTTGPEILAQTGSRIDAFVDSQGSGGTLTGVGRFLRQHLRHVKLYAVEPSEAPTLSQGRWGSHKIEGIGDGFVPENLDLSLLDGIVTVSSADAIHMTRRLSHEEGIFCGISSGCNVAAVLKVVKRHPELKRIVTMINDSGDRYFSTEVFGVEKKIPVPERAHTLDEHSVKQLQTYRTKFELIE